MKLLVGTRKGLFRVEHRRNGWHVSEPSFLGVPVINATRDARDGSIWACIGHGHWGPKLAVSRNDLASFDDVPAPAFPEGCRIDSDTPWGKVDKKASVRVLYTIVPASPEPGHYYIGCDPGGMFTTRDGGENWELHEPLWKIRNEDGWFEGGGGTMLHTILVEPGNHRRVFVAVSCAGVYESTDGGATWAPRNKGVIADFLPDKYPEVGQDTHMLAQSARNKQLLWQQNHCGNYKSTDGGMTWVDVMPDSPHDIGFGIALDDDNEDVAWTAPMESDERRVARDGALVVMRTRDGGASWEELREGLPQRNCYDIVFRHALDAHAGSVAFGTTCGRLYVSADRGDRWELAAPYLPPVSSVRFERD